MDVSEPTTKPTRSLRNTVGGRGAPFKNKQWVGVNGVRSHSGSPAPAEGRWERGGYRGGRGRGGVFNDHREHMGSSANVVDSVLEAVETDMDKPEDDAPEQTVGRLKTWEEVGCSLAVSYTTYSVSLARQSPRSGPREGHQRGQDG